jgi:F420H(2)-dependent quinone reductase
VATRSGGLGKAMARGFLRTAVWAYRRSGGRVGGRMFGVPVLLLTTRGRKSGRSWTVPLMFQPDGDGWVIIASNGGSPRHPAWWLNLRAASTASAQIGRDVHPVAATEVTGDERDRLWRVMTAVYPTYDQYATKTSRTIPVVSLRPQ